MIINHNMSSLYTDRVLNISNDSIMKNMEKLSSGERINRAGDDASGLAVSEKMRSQIRGLNQASKNITNAVSFIQTTEGYLGETTDILQRVRELAVQAANDTNVDADRTSIKAELDQLSAEITRISTDTQFNTMNLLNGDFSAKNFQIGANEGQSMAVEISNMSADELGVNDVQIGDYETATASITTVNNALETVSTQRSALGAIQNRLEHTIANDDNTSENLQAAESRIRDVDMAKEMVGYSKDSILQQAAQSMLAQANQSTQGVLSLLQ